MQVNVATPGYSQSMYAGSPATSATSASEKGPSESFTPAEGRVPADRPRLIVIDHHHQPVGLLQLTAIQNGEKVKVPHGQEVIDTARVQGYQGPVYPFENASTPYRQASQMRKIADKLWDKNESAEQLRSSLYAEVLASRVAMMNSISQDLELLHQKGVTGAVVNVSLGSGLASGVLAIFVRRYGDDAVQHEEGYQSKRFCQAFGCDYAKFASDDPEVADSEAKKLMQKLLDFAESTSDDIEFRASKGRYDSSVKEFTGNRNSLVIAASNDGEFAETISLISRSPIQVPSHFQANDLAHPQALVVGAVELEGDRVQVSGYSSDYQGVNFYATGKLAHSEGSGTSFAAPRVAAVLAQLHYENQDQTSSEIEDLLRAKFSGSLQDYQGRQPAPVLDERAAQDYLIAKHAR